MCSISFDSLRTRLVLLVLIAVLPALGLMLLTTFEHRKTAVATLQEETLRLVRLAVSHEKHVVNGTRQLLASLAELREVQSMNSDSCAKIFEGVLRQYPQYVNIAAADAKGEFFCSAAPLQEKVHVDLADLRHFREAVESGKFSVGNYQTDPVVDKPALHFAYPVLGSDGKSVAAILAAFDLSWFGNLAADIHLPDGAAFTVRDSDGTILARYPDPEQWVARSVPEAGILQAMLSQKEGVAETRGIDGIRRIYAFSALRRSPESGVFVSVGIPSETAYAKSDHELKRNLAGLAVAAVLAILAARFFGELFVMRRVYVLLDATQRLAAGQRNIRVSSDKRVSGPDEIGKLARAFDEMAKAIEERESALEKSENEYKAIFETTGTSTVLIDEDTTIVRANRQFEKLSGFPKEELENRKSWTLFFVEENLRIMRNYHRLRRINPDLAPACYETRFVDRFGSLSEVLVNVSMVQGAKRSVISFLDISEEKKAVDALRRSEEHYRRFFEEDLTGDFIADPSSRIKSYNPAFASMFATNSDRGKSDWSLTDFFGSKAAWNEFLAELKRNKRLEYWEAQLKRLDQKRVDVIGNVIGAFDENMRLVEIKGYFFDDTERKRLQTQVRQSQKMEAVGRLAGGVAHDFNNYLSVIFGNTEMLLYVIPADNPSRKKIEEIRKAGERASLLTRQLLAFGRKQVFQVRTISLNWVVSEMEKMLRRLIGEHIRLNIVQDPELAPVRVDVGQIQQVIMNLAVNSRDAMPEGGEISIETKNLALDENACGEFGVEAGSYALLTVADNGVGIDRETIGMIYEPFFTTKNEGKGTGLGLSTVYGIVRQSKGGIRVHSEQGKGTSFYVCFPAHTGPSEAEEPAGSGCHGTSTQSVHDETILLVEDEDMLRTTFLRMLRSRGFRVLEARNGAEAIRVCDEFEGEIQLMISDVVMPELSGLKAAEALAAKRPDMKVLFTSGYPDKAADFLDDVSCGHIPFLQKPFGADSLLTKVRQILDS